MSVRTSLHPTMTKIDPPTRVELSFSITVTNLRMEMGLFLILGKHVDVVKIHDRLQKLSQIYPDSTIVTEGSLFELPIPVYTLEDEKEIYLALSRAPVETVILESELINPVLRKFITKAKSRGSLITHVHPGEEYQSNVRNREHWYE